MSPICPGLGDFEVSVLYDRERQSPSGCQTRLFVRPIGQDGKSVVDTNMVMVGMLPNPHRFLMRSIRLAFFEFGRPVPILDPVYWNSIFEFYVGSRRFYRFPAYQVADPLVTFCGVVGWYTFSQQDRERFIAAFQKRLIDAGTERSVSFDAGWPRLEGLELDTGQPFYANIITPDRSATREVFVALEGQELQAVQ